MIYLPDYAQLTELINFIMDTDRMIFRIHLRQIGIL